MADAFLGEIRLIPYSKVPNYWAACDGSTLPIQGNEALFSLLGTLYGGDGKTTFGLPDLRGRIPIGMSASGGTYQLGNSGGQENVTLTTAQVPAHSHYFVATPATATSPVPMGTTFANNPSVLHYANIPTTPKWADLSGQAMENSGGNQSHTNMMPTIGLRYCICTSGLYPLQG